MLFTPWHDTAMCVHHRIVKQKHPTDVECFCFGNRRRRVAIRAFLCLCRSAAQPSPCARSLLYATGKCKPFRCSSFHRNYRSVTHFPVAFSYSSLGVIIKQKHPTDVECFCFGNRRRHTLPDTCPRHILRFSSPLGTRCRGRSPCAQYAPFRVVKMQSRSLRSSFHRNYRVARSFSLRGARVLHPRAPILVWDVNNILLCVM